jgi:hypothetical protein
LLTGEALEGSVLIIDHLHVRIILIPIYKYPIWNPLNEVDFNAYEKESDKAFRYPVFVNIDELTQHITHSK